MIEELTPPQAWAMLNENKDAVLLDVRSRVEHDYVGHPPGAVLVPWKDPPYQAPDPEFVVKAVKALQQSRPGRDPAMDLTVLTLCRSGMRSRAAAEALQKSGFKRVYNVTEGFEGARDEEKHRGNLDGWRFHKLPWEQT
jgi:rhodanese-related sulfurtransferase